MRNEIYIKVCYKGININKQIAMAAKKKEVAASKKAVVVAVQEPVSDVVADEPVSSSEETTLVEEGDKKRVMNAVPRDFQKLVMNNLPGSALSAKDVKTVCEVFVKTLVSHVKSGETVSFTNNMTFKRVARDDRTHKNPKTGDEVFKPAHYVMVMEVKQALKKQFEEVPVTKVSVPAKADDPVEE
jgi:nucleoid DNA-binding protein